MWFFRKKEAPVRELLKGATDFHSHILPGVDDGVKTLEESLAILSLYEELGIQSVWLTPHIMEDIPNTTDRLKERFAELREAYCGNIRLNLAAEYMLDSLFEERLSNNDLLPIGEKGDHILVETSYFNPPYNLRQSLRNIQSKGYYPILAHPERYMYMEKEDYSELKEMGVKFQLNLMSLAGGYGNTVKKKALELQKKAMYDLKGTDVHSLGMIMNMVGR